MKRSDHQIIQAAFDGSLTATGLRTLQDRIRNEPKMAALYHDYALLDHSLREEFEGKELIGHPLPQPARRRVPAVAAVGIAAAVVLTGFLIWLAVPNTGPAPSPPVTASLSFSDDSAWTIDGSRPNGDPPAVAPGSRLELTSGSAELDMPGGASAWVEGPAALVYHSGERIELTHGSGRFRNATPGRRLSVETGFFTAIDLGTEFAVACRPGGSDELHVFAGQVKLLPRGATEGPVLSAGEAASVGPTGTIDRMAARASRFPAELPRFRRILVDRFVATASTINGRRPVFGPAAWRLEKGSALLADGCVEGSNFTAFVAMPEAPSAEHPVLLASMEVAASSSGTFHTSGWAGLSFFHRDTEHLFFGDSFGPELTWSLDVKQRKPPVVPVNRITGARTVTLRYDFRTGETSLHDGAIPLGPAFVKGLLPPGLSFDRVRLGASPEATIAVRSIDVRVMD